MKYFEEFPDIKIEKGDKKLLRRSIAKALSEAIYSGFLPPGLRLVESQIAGKFGISRTPIREAIHQLEIEGLVMTIPNKGAVVMAHSLEEIEEVHMIYGALEGLAASLSVKSINKDDLKQMEVCIAKMGANKNDRDRREWFIYNDRFHSLFLKPCGKKFLLKSIKNYTKQVARYWYLLLSYPGSIERFSEEHRSIVEAFKSRSPTAVRRSVEKHLRSVSNIIIESLQTITPTEFGYPPFWNKG
jgi:DNA-binding GntR family transcriptional regulator